MKPWSRIKPALRLLLYGAGSRSAPAQVDSSARLEMRGPIVRTSGNLVVGPGSTLVIGEGVELSSDLIIGRDCRVLIGRGACLRNATFSIRNGATVELGEEVRFDNPLPAPNPVVVDGGILTIGDRARLHAEVLVRFAGRLTIGSYTGIGYGSEIRCEEQVDIGRYGLFSYDVCIYDTNTHAVDWQERRAVIQRMHRTGEGELRRPDTKPVRIGDDVWIGKGASVLKGSQIGNRCIVGMRTIVGGGSFADDTVIVSPPPRTIGRQ